MTIIILGSQINQKLDTIMAQQQALQQQVANLQATLAQILKAVDQQPVVGMKLVFGKPIPQ